MGLFDRMLEHVEQSRHRGLLLEAHGVTSSPARAHRAGEDGFLPFAEAARVMGVDTEELSRMMQTGLLSWRNVAGDVLVQPAIVSRMAVRSERGV